MSRTEEIDLTCYEKLDGSLPGNQVSKPEVINEGVDREVARIMAVTPLAEAQPRVTSSDDDVKRRPQSPPTPQNPPEPDYPPSCETDASECEHAKQTIGLGSVFRPIQLDEEPVGVASPKPEARRRMKRPRANSSGSWFSAGFSPFFDRASERVRTNSSQIRDGDQAYPYCRRHSHELGGMDGRAFFSWLGLRETADHRLFPDNDEEFALAPPIILQLDQADWRLYATFNVPTFTPVAPFVADSDDVNSSMHDYTDERFSIAPMFAPPVGGITQMRRSDWLSVQRGMLLAMEELARHAIHNQSALMYALRKARQQDVGTVDYAAAHSVIDTLIYNQNSGLIAMMHHVIYAHRHALVRDRSPEGKAVVLRQPIFAQRRLFERYVTKH